MQELIDFVKAVVPELDAESERDPQFAMTWHSARFLFEFFALPVRIAASLEL